MKNEDEKLREAARMLSVNCEGYRDGCEGCLFCRDNLSCKIDGIPMWWDSDFGLDHSAGTGKKVGDRMVEVSKTIDSIVVHQLIHQLRPIHQPIHQLPAPKSSTPRRKS